MADVTNDPYFVYRTFMRRDDAVRMLQFFLDHGLPGYVLDQSPSFDPFFAKTELTPWHTLHLLPADFETADRLLLHHAQAEASTLAVDHPLQECSASDLQKIVQQGPAGDPSDWAVAQFLLKQKFGLDPDTPIPAALDREGVPMRLTALHVLRLMALSLLGGWFALYPAWLMRQAKRVGVGGHVDWTYDAWSRRFLLGIIVWSLICLVIFIGVAVRVAL